MHKAPGTKKSQLMYHDKMLMIIVNEYLNNKLINGTKTALSHFYTL